MNPPIAGQKFRFAKHSRIAGEMVHYAKCLRIAEETADLPNHSQIAGGMFRLEDPPARK